ncbi:MAG: hypothetical protein AAGD00_01180 [Planctomycetota bacterium]
MPYKRTAQSEPRHARSGFAAAGSGCVLLLLVLSVTPALVATPSGTLSAKRSMHQSSALAMSVATDPSQRDDHFQPAPVPHDRAPRVPGVAFDASARTGPVDPLVRAGLTDLPPPTA